LRCEVRDVRENGPLIRNREAKPLRKRPPVLIQRRLGNPAPLAALVIGPGRREGWEGAIEVTPDHRSAHYELVTSPSVVGTAARRNQRASKIRQREGCHRRGHSQHYRRLVKRLHRLAQLREETRLWRELVFVRVEASKRAKEDLPLHPEKRRALRDDPGDLLQLVAKPSVGENSGDRCGVVERLIEQVGVCNGSLHRVACGPRGRKKELPEREREIESPSARLVPARV